MWIAACDDDPEFEHWLERQIRPALSSEDIYTTYRSGVSLLDAAQSAGKPIDVLLLDMEMQGINGLETALELRQICPGAIIIVISTYKSYALPCYEIKAFHYLIKPVDITKLMNILSEARRISQLLLSEVLCIQTRQDIVYLPAADVLYIESRQRALYAHTHSQEFRFSGKLHILADSLRDKGFCRAHKSYIINMAYVKHIDKTARCVTLTDSVTLPVGNRRMEGLASSVLAYRKNTYGRF